MIRSLETQMPLKRLIFLGISFYGEARTWILCGNIRMSNILKDSEKTARIWTGHQGCTS